MHKIMHLSPPNIAKSAGLFEKRVRSDRFTDLNADKLRGGYYTSKNIAQWICDWAIRSPADLVLEPSCGDGVFLDCAVQKFCDLGVQPSKISSRICGIEIISEEAEKARDRIRKNVDSQEDKIVITEDFFSWLQNYEHPKFDAVIGNPPFIRYQSFPEPHRTLSMKMMEKEGLKPNRLTNIWVPFVVGAVASLKVGGRIALVLPAELLQVTYAAQLRSFLTDRFTRIDIIACNELFFEKAEQEVVLLLADGALAVTSPNNACRVTLTETQKVNEITQFAPEIILSKASPKTIHHEQEKWLKYFLTGPEIEFMRELRASSVVTSLKTHANVDVGVVTGKNEFFVVNQEKVAEFNLSEYTVPLVSRSAHLRGISIDQKEWSDLAASEDRVHLLHLAPHQGKPFSKSLKEYLNLGELQEVHKGYKCSIRSSWYAVPSVWIPDGFVFRQIYDFPRFVLNNAQATSTDTIHRLSCKEDPIKIISNTYTYLTAASAEIEGRSYGGGVLELEPTEAERLLIPTKLCEGLPFEECDRLIRAGRLEDLLEENCRLILIAHMGLDRAACNILRGIWTKMRDRRLSRSKKSRLKTDAGEKNDGRLKKKSACSNR